MFVYYRELAPKLTFCLPHYQFLTKPGKYLLPLATLKFQLSRTWSRLKRQQASGVIILNFYFLFQ